MTQALPTRAELEGLIAAKTYVAEHLTDPVEYEIAHDELNDLLEQWTHLSEPA